MCLSTQCMAFLYLPLITIICARCLLSKDTNMSACFKEKHELMVMIFPRCMTEFHGKVELKTVYCLAIHIPW